jgi:hypothetical protein
MRMFVVINRATNKIVKRGFATRQHAKRSQENMGEKLHAVKLEADHKGG